MMTSNDNQLTVQGFDYCDLPAPDVRRCEAAVSKIDARHRKIAADIVAIGKELLEVKGRLEHGQFGPWLKHYFGWSQPTASRMMQAADTFKSFNLNNFTIDQSALYLMSSNQCDDDTRNELLERAEQGERITHAVAKQALEPEVEEEEPEAEEEAAQEPAADVEDVQEAEEEESAQAATQEVEEPAAEQEPPPDVEEEEEEEDPEDDFEREFEVSEISLRDLGGTADEGDAEAIDKLRIMAVSVNLGHNDYETWTQLATAISEQRKSKKRAEQAATEINAHLFHSNLVRLPPDNPWKWHAFHDVIDFIKECYKENGFRNKKREPIWREREALDAKKEVINFLTYEARLFCLDENNQHARQAVEEIEDWIADRKDRYREVK